jgi:hypothetical protein
MLGMCVCGLGLDPLPVCTAGSVCFLVVVDQLNLVTFIPAMVILFDSPSGIATWYHFLFLFVQEFNIEQGFEKNMK